MEMRADEIYQVAVSLHVSEWRQLEERANQVGMTVDHFMRSVLGFGEMKVSPTGVTITDPAPVTAMSRQPLPLKEIKRRINQIGASELHKLPGTALIYVTELCQQRDALQAKLNAAEGELNALREAWTDHG